MQLLNVEVEDRPILMDRAYEMWWRDTGQFLQPCDQLSGDALIPFKQFGKSVHDGIEAEVASRVLEREDEIDEMAETFLALKKDIRNELNSGEGNAKILKRIKELVEEE